MFKSIDEYQKQYFEVVFKSKQFEYGYYSESCDSEFINGNSIIIENDDQFLVSSIMLLLNQITTVKRVQIPSGVIELPISDELIALIKYTKKGISIDRQISYNLVSPVNFEVFLDISEKLQYQEYGDTYKIEFNNAYFKQDDYELYLIEYKNKVVGEFMFIPSIKSIESIMILEEYRNIGIGKSILELFSTNENTDIYLSADDSSIGFYKKIGATVIDQKSVVNLYGNNRNLIGYLSMINF